MDNNSVEMQAKENNPKKNGRIAVCCCIVAAICIVVATVLVMHFRNSDGAAITGTDTTESESNSDQSQDNETEAETEAPKPEFEISEAGVLTAYNGDDETVVIPDNVISIGEDAFGTSPYADEIKTVKLGKSVEDIDVQAFVSLTKLENVEVPEENSNFISGDGVLIKTDNSVFFCMPSIITDQNDMFMVFFNIISDKVDYSGSALLVSESTVAEIEMEYVTLEEKDIINRKYYLSCNAISARNQKVEFDTPIYYEYAPNMEHSNGIYVFEAKEGVVVSNTAWDTGYGKTWILSQNGIGEIEIKAPYYTDKEIGVEVKDGVWYDYNYSIILFYHGDDDTIKYSRFPHKFMIISDGYGSISKYCTGMDEFAKEIGTVEIVKGEVMYHCEERLTVEDDMVGQYIKDSFDSDIYGYPTLDQYLAHNAEIYESAK